MTLYHVKISGHSDNIKLVFRKIKYKTAVLSKELTTEAAKFGK